MFTTRKIGMTMFLIGSLGCAVTAQAKSTMFTLSYDKNIFLETQKNTSLFILGETTKSFNKNPWVSFNMSYNESIKKGDIVDYIDRDNIDKISQIKLNTIPMETAVSVKLDKSCTKPLQNIEGVKITISTLNDLWGNSHYQAKCFMLDYPPQN